MKKNLFTISIALMLGLSGCSALTSNNSDPHNTGLNGACLETYNTLYDAMATRIEDSGYGQLSADAKRRAINERMQGMASELRERSDSECQAATQRMLREMGR